MSIKTHAKVTLTDPTDHAEDMNNTKSRVRSAIVRAADSVEKLRASDAWRVYDAALELGVVAEVKNALREANPAAFAAMCEYEADEINANLA